jgi:hypothetical protein
MLFPLSDCLQVLVTIARSTTQFDSQKLNLIRKVTEYGYQNTLYIFQHYTTSIPI